jgi:hypothetical protein
LRCDVSEDPAASAGQLVAPERLRLAAHFDSPFGEEVFNVAVAGAEAMAEPDRVLDDGRRDSVPLSARRNAMAICFSVQLDFFTS